jgi:hypothetical protein
MIAMQTRVEAAALHSGRNGSKSATTSVELSHLDQCMLKIIHLDPRLAYRRDRDRLRLIAMELDPTFNPRRVGRSIVRLKAGHAMGVIQSNAFTYVPRDDPSIADCMVVVDDLATLCDWDELPLIARQRKEVVVLRLLGQVSNAVTR